LGSDLAVDGRISHFLFFGWRNVVGANFIWRWEDGEKVTGFGFGFKSIWTVRVGVFLCRVVLILGVSILVLELFRILA
jgi:hypothetical protein